MKPAVWSSVNSDVTGSVPRDSHPTVLEDVAVRGTPHQLHDFSARLKSSPIKRVLKKKIERPTGPQSEALRRGGLCVSDSRGRGRAH